MKFDKCLATGTVLIGDLHKNLFSIQNMSDQIKQIEIRTFQCKNCEKKVLFDQQL